MVLDTGKVSVAIAVTGGRSRSTTPISDNVPHLLKIVEFDSPKALLDQRDSKFYGLASEAGLA